MTDVKLPPLPERLLEFDGPLWGLMGKWMAAEPGGEAETYADAIDASIVETMQAYARLAVLQERERCAKVCDDWDCSETYGWELAGAIRKGE